MENVMFSNKDNGFKVVVNHRYDNKPMIVIFPGGGYHHLSTREAIPVSNKFLSLGYNTTIVYYSVAPYANFVQEEQANLVIKELSKKYSDIFVVGFSAGGHLAGLSATQEKVHNIKGMVLCYPVISLNEYTHKGTQENFLKDCNTLENQTKYSIHNRVNESTVPCFIWTTKDDASVPYQNTLMMIDKLNENKVFNRHVIFPSGPHGMALADESAIKDGDTSYVNKEVAMWPDLVDEFIKEVISNGKK